jgi:chromosome partitioning protein
MKTIALLNMKGGVGKTTLAVNLAWSLSRHQGLRVLLVDLDPQFNASQYLMTYDNWDAHRKKHGTVANILLDAQRTRMALKDDTVKREEFSILASIERNNAKKSYLYLLPSELDLAKAVKNPQGVEFRLQKLLDRWENYFDYVLLDCAPTDTVLTATALMASNYVLVPIKPDRFSILGYGLMQETLANFQSDYPNPKKVADLGVVFTSVSIEPHPIEAKCKADVKKSAQYIFKTEIHISTSYLRAVYEKTPIFDTRFAHSVPRGEMVALASEISARIAAIEGSQKATP